MASPSMETALSYFVSRAISRKTGILKGVRLLYRDAGDPLAFTGIGELADTERIFSAKGEVSGTGVGQSFSHALLAAMGESIEGYSSYEIFTNLEFKTYNELRAAGKEAVSPCNLPLYSPSQYANAEFPFAPFTEESKIGWVKSFSVSSGRERFIPAGQVYISYKPSGEEKRICHTIFGGVACGISYNRTLLSAIYEVIERDTMMIWWLNQLPLPKINVDNDTAALPLLKNIAANSNFSLESWKITLDLGVPVIFSLLRDKANNSIAGGFGTNLNPKTALLKSVYECVQNRLGQLPMKHSWGQSLYNDKIGFNVLEEFEGDLTLQELVKRFSQSKNLYANLQFYLYPQTHACLQEVCSSSAVVGLSELKDWSSENIDNDLHYCLSLLSQHGFDVLVTDLTSEDIRELGFVVLRVNIPGLVPNSVTAWPHLGNERIFKIPEQIGYKRKTEGELTQVPLPYA